MYAEVSFGKFLHQENTNIELPANVSGEEGKDELFLHELEVSTSP